MSRNKLFRLFCFFCFVCLLPSICKADDSICYIPEFHGAFRGRWEMETTDGFSRFQVRNARVIIEGKVAPIISYKVNTDFCDRGKILILDAFATISPVKGAAVKVGQYRMPFGYESFRGPGTYFFNNRSFIGKHVNNYRAVGVSARYSFPIPLSAEAGVFNPTVITDHTKWVKKYAYAGRLVYKPGDFVFATGFESIIPDSTRINLASVTAGWRCGAFYTEAEYMARMYTHHSHATTHAYNVFVSYSIPLRKSVFDTLSFQARMDGMTALANGMTAPNTDGFLTTTGDSRNRLTVGATLDYKYKVVRAAVRINYEKYWYKAGHIHDPGTDDVLSAELIIKF